MNEQRASVAIPDQGSDTPAPSTNEDGPSSSTEQHAAERPSLLERITGLFRHRNGTNLREDLADALSETAAAEAGFSPAERAMLNNILRLREVRVEDVMIPRADIEAVEHTATLADVMKAFEETGHSRMPVYADTLDDPRGMVHIKDLMVHISRQARARKSRGKKVATAQTAPAPAVDLGNVDLSKTLGELNLIRPVLFVPPSMLASDLMARMQAGHVQMALVIDEYGGTDGLVSLEDLVEMVVGDIEDEHDESEPLITRAGDGIFIVDGKAEIEDVAAVIGDAFKAGEHGENVDTIGGMIFNTLGRVPTRGEVVHAVPGFEFHVLDADPRRVKRVRIVNDQKAERRRRLTQAAAQD